MVKITCSDLTDTKTGYEVVLDELICIRQERDLLVALNLDNVTRIEHLQNSQQFLQQMLDKERRQRSKLRHSISWKITRPLRSLGRILSSLTKFVSRSPAIIATRATPGRLTVAMARATFIAISNSDSLKEKSSAAEVGKPPVDDLGRQKSTTWIDSLSHTEQLKLRPETFDGSMYLRENPDLLAAGVDPFEHYVKYGAAEGREAPDGYLGEPECASWFDSSAQGATAPISSIGPLTITKDVVIVVAHEATRSGAPILTYNISRELQQSYHVVLFTLAGGNLLPNFQEVADVIIGPLEHRQRRASYIQNLLQQCLGNIKPRYAILNSIECQSMIDPLAKLGIPRVVLVHEFAACFTPSRAFNRGGRLGDALVFSAAIVGDSARVCWPALADRSIHILAQGSCVRPVAHDTHAAADERARISAAMRPERVGDDCFVVVGCGSVHIRKGIDLFLMTAHRVCLQADCGRFRFVWVGGGYNPVSGSGNYSIYLKEQIDRAGIGQYVDMLDEVADPDEAFRQANLFLLSSRLDPLPNVAIDAMTMGLPVVCFDRASGIADILREDPTTAYCVVPYCDVAAAAERIVAIADDPQRQNALSAAVRGIAATTFQMDRYVARLDRIGRGLRVVTDATQVRDFATLKNDTMFDATFFLQEQDDHLSRDDAIHKYLNQSAATLIKRKPCPGFHPGVYVEAGRFEFEGDAFADFIRCGKPSGPWLQQVLSPVKTEPCGTASSQARVAVHLHLHYAELLSEILDRLATNMNRFDLLISTSTEAAIAAVNAYFSGGTPYRCDVRLMPNRGRDLGAMLTVFAADIAGYDLICHIHTKKSPHLESTAFVTRWREILYEHLLGGRYNMADQIVTFMQADDGLGLVYPEDPNLVGWTDNRPAAERLALRLGLSDDLPTQIDFPVGTMFWARPKALASLLDTAFCWEDYSAEPAGIDGTMLCAIERLLPIIANAAGYRTATVHVPGVGR